MRRIDSLEGLRGTLALWVVFGHVVTLAGFGSDWRGPFRVMVSGGHAVDVFVILSGFVIFLLIDRAREPYTVFIWRRFWRPFPAFAICCAIMLALTPVVAEALAEWPLAHPLNASRLRIMQDTLAHMGWQVAAHVPMLHGIIPPDALPNSSFAILGQAWSISPEWQFYLLAPVLFAALCSGGAACRDHGGGPSPLCRGRLGRVDHPPHPLFRYRDHLVVPLVHAATPLPARRAAGRDGNCLSGNP